MAASPRTPVVEMTEAKGTVLAVKQIKDLIRKIATLSAFVGTEQKTAPGGMVLGPREVKSLVSRVCAQIDGLGKQAKAGAGRKAKRAAPRPGADNQFRRLFYVSDQLVAYFKQANLGNALAVYFVKPELSHAEQLRYIKMDGETQAEALEAKLFELEGVTSWDAFNSKNGTEYNSESFSVKALVKYALESQMANSGILTALFAMVVFVNDLKSKKNGQRIKYDDAMFRAFGQGNTHYVIKDVDMTAALTQLEKTEAPEVFKRRFDTDKGNLYETVWLPHIKQTPDGKRYCDLPAFERLQTEKPIFFRRKGQEARTAEGEIKVGYAKFDPFVAHDDLVHTDENDDYGFLYSMNMKLNSYFRVPEVIVKAAVETPKTMLDLLVNPASIEALNGIQSNLKSIGEPRKKLVDEEKKTHRA